MTLDGLDVYAGGMTVFSEALELKIAGLPSRRREAVTAALKRLVPAVVAEDTETLEAFVRLGVGHGDVRARNAARLELLGDRVRSQSVAGRELRSELGISRQRMQQLRESGRLLGVQPPLASEYWYPRWQFQGGEVQKVLPRLLAAARERGLSPLGLHLRVTDPGAGIGGTPLAELLEKRPDDVVAIVAGAGEIGS